MTRILNTPNLLIMFGLFCIAVGVVMHVEYWYPDLSVILSAPNLVIFVGLIYLAIGVMFLYDGLLGLGIAYLGYAFSNVGLYIAAMKAAQQP